MPRSGPIARSVGAAIAALLFGLAAAYAALSFPALSGRVVDDAGILSSDTRDTLTNLLAEHEIELTINSRHARGLEVVSFQWLETNV